MAVIINALENDHIVKLQASENWTVNEMTAAAHKAAALCSQSAVPMHILIDVSQAKRLPEEMLHARSLPDLVRLNNSYVVIVGADALVRTMANALAIMAQSTRVQHFNTVRDAMAYLRMVNEAERTIIA